MSNYVIPSLNSACEILRLIVESPKTLSRDQIAEILTIPRSSTYRILQTLKCAEMVVYRNRKYYPGPGLYTLSLKLNSTDRLRPICLPVLNNLVKSTGFTAHIAVPSGFRSLLIEVVDGQHASNKASRAGTTAPAHVSATGKVFLAYLWNDELDIVNAETGFSRFTARTHTTMDEVRHEVQCTLKRGYGVDDREFDDGTRCLAVPVFNASATVAAAIGVTAPAGLFSKDDIPEVAAIIKKHAQHCYMLLKGEMS
ncbi:IclR family transcriptional regulator [Aestuariibacter sp. GS-14]|uniref:IclR family transcriptional regulator n=1 Tax=Aestuariibacter sp. GS-14 TaxID=2590670 RepID=UPI00112DC040|nr:IclR family transcriptional regulator [Aestuariibacter sp. GS-14]TPV58542.1 IclR family transcriptional regulator [Aestuariibacter sp. GS-14]